MDYPKNKAYLEARKKLEALKGFYNHLAVYIVVNLAIILVSANVFNSKAVDLFHWTNYITAFFWGFGLVSHGLYVLFFLNSKNNFLKRWEDRKIREFLEKDNF
ncbi:2TM domain-containing protein [Aequorivita echinoideorum]|nr:2TM domain-containing protein [Aequorivita echinoideorum]